MGDGAAGFTEVNTGDAIADGGASCHTLAVDLNGDGVKLSATTAFLSPRLLVRTGPVTLRLPALIRSTPTFMFQTEGALTPTPPTKCFSTVRSCKLSPNFATNICFFEGFTSPVRFFRRERELHFAGE